MEKSEAYREKRRKKNLARKIARRLCAAGRALPPVVALSRAEFYRMGLGGAEEYDNYAEALIAGAKKARRRWEFPLEPAGGVSYPSFKNHRKGMAV